MGNFLSRFHRGGGGQGRKHEQAARLNAIGEADNGTYQRTADKTDRDTAGQQSGMVIGEGKFRFERWHDRRRREPQGESHHHTER